MKRVCLVLVLCPLLLGCGLHQAALQLQRSRLELELSSLRDLERRLSGPFPPGQNHVSIVVRWDTINQILAAADGREMPIEGVPGAVLRVQSIRVQGQHGAPLLDIAASASKSGATLEVKLLAMLVVNNNGSAGPVFRVRVSDIKPVFSWRCVRLASLGLARRLLTAEADRLALNHIAFPIPTTSLFTLRLPAQRQVWRQDTPRGNGSWIELELTRPGAVLDKRFVLEPPVFLTDGVHLFGSIH